MSLPETYRCARALEAIENYARADDPLVESIDDSVAGFQRSNIIPFDHHFWHEVLQGQQAPWDQEFTLFGVALCEWVARVPGLFWSDHARALRDLAKDAVEYKSRNWVTYQPRGKSQIVLGGVGTLKFPPDESGRRLVTLSCGHNASSGIPALIFPEVWEHYKLAEGDVIMAQARWQKMATGWAERFPSIKGIPRGYLVLKKPEQLREISERKQPTQFHPCTVMEYSKGDAKLFDFVYATADTRVANYRGKLERFFSKYKNDKERYGRYLLAADINVPLWEAEYTSPAELRRAEAGASAQLELLRARVRELSFKGTTIDSIVQVLAGNCDNVSLRRYSRQIDIPEAQWFTGGSVADSAVQLLQKCLKRNKVEELLDAISLDYPKLFIAGG